MSPVFNCMIPDEPVLEHQNQVDQVLWFVCVFVQVCLSVVSCSMQCTRQRCVGITQKDQDTCLLWVPACICGWQAILQFD